MVYSTKVVKDGKDFTVSFSSYFERFFFNRQMKKNGFVCENTSSKSYNPVCYRDANDAIESIAGVF